MGRYNIEEEEQETLRELAMMTRAREVVKPWAGIVNLFPALGELLDRAGLSIHTVSDMQDANMVVAICEAFQLGGRTNQCIPI